MNAADTRTARISSAKSAAKSGSLSSASLETIRTGNACLLIEAAAPAVRTLAHWLVKAARPALVQHVVRDFALECVAEGSAADAEAVELACKVIGALLVGNWTPTRTETAEAVDAAIGLLAA